MKTDLSWSGTQTPPPTPKPHITMKTSLIRIPASIALCLLNFCVLAPKANASGTAPGEIGDYVWMDLNQNGIQDPGEPGIPGVTVTLTDSIGISVTTTTDANGLYFFRDLGPGTYTVTVATPSGLIASPTLVEANRAVDSNGSGTIVTLQRGAYVNTTIDFGFYAPTGSIGNFVWQDLNVNGIQDPGEPGINGVTVQLTDAADPGTVLLTAVTADNGAYLFTGLAAGTYQVIVDTSSPALAGFVPTLAEAPSGTPENDSDASPLTVVLPTNSTEDLNADFGYYRLSSLSGFVYVDADNDGAIDATELAIPGVTVTLTGLDFTGAAVNLPTTTAPDGSYLFANLQPSGGAGYTITETQPVDYDDGKDTIGTPGGNTDINDVFYAVVLGSAVDGEYNNFGELEPPPPAPPVATSPVGTGDTATIGYWQNKNGQALIKAVNGGCTSTAFANWLAASYPYLYGVHAKENNLTGKNNKAVAALFVTFFKVKGTKTNAQVMAGAIAAYVTNSTLAGGNYAAKYGFNVSTGGTGATTYNVGSLGTSIGLLNNTAYTVSELLQQANLMKQLGTFNAGSFNTIFDGINIKGDII